MNKRQLERWGRRRVKGKWHFVFVQNMLRIGLLVSLVFATAMTYLDGNSIQGLLSGVGLKEFAFDFLILEVIFFILSLIMWRSGEREYLRKVGKDQ